MAFRDRKFGATEILAARMLIDPRRIRDNAQERLGIP